MIRKYSLAKNGAKLLAPDFKVRELRCRDGSDTVMVDDALMLLLQCIREHFGKVVTNYQRLPHGSAQRGRGRCQEQPAPAGPGGGHPGAGRERGGRGRLRRKPDAGLGRRWPLSRQGGQSHRLGTRGHPGRQSPVEGVNAMTSIISAIIAGAGTLIGVLIANGKSQAVTDTKLEELTREVREHNNFARRVPILEEQMKVANHRIADLEKERN